MPIGDRDSLSWKKSSFSNSGTCVEVAAPNAAGALVHVRDSKDAEGSILAFAPESWCVFLQVLRKEGCEFPENSTNGADVVDRPE